MGAIELLVDAAADEDYDEASAMVAAARAVAKAAAAVVVAVVEVLATALGILLEVGVAFARAVVAVAAFDAVVSRSYTSAILASPSQPDGVRPSGPDSPA